MQPDRRGGRYRPNAMTGKKRKKQQQSKAPRAKSAPPRRKAPTTARAKPKKRPPKRAAKRTRRKPAKPRKAAPAAKTAQRKRRTKSKVSAPPVATRPATPALAPPEPAGTEVGEQAALRAKFELGPHEWTQLLDAREKAQTIPWGYGHDRVTAMAIDPERLFVYWEVTDEGLAGARAEVGAADDAGTLVLRLHDVTGLLFDGGNAHHTTDVVIGRADRRWFLDVGRPTSTVIVEIGLRGRDGRFAPIARSHRVDFPRREPAPAGPIEWLTVRELPVDQGGPRLDIAPAPAPASAPMDGDRATSPASRSAADESDLGDRGGGRSSGDNHSNSGGGSNAITAADDWQATRKEFRLAGAPWFSTAPGDLSEEQFANPAQFDEWFTANFGDVAWAFSGERWEWLGPALLDPRSPVTASSLDDAPWLVAPWLVIEPQAGGVTTQSIGPVTRVRRAPWTVAIRRVDTSGTTGERTLARWELRRSWLITATHEASGARRWFSRALLAAPRAFGIDTGASEQSASDARTQLGLGASERRLDPNEAG